MGGRRCLGLRRKSFNLTFAVDRLLVKTDKMLILGVHIFHSEAIDLAV